MNSNSDTQQPKLILQKTTYSLVLGIIGMILPFIRIWRLANYISALEFLLTFIVAMICTILGLTLGIKGLKSNRKNLAIAGIAVCAVVLLFWMYLLIVWIVMAGWMN